MTQLKIELSLPALQVNAQTTGNVSEDGKTHWWTDHSNSNSYCSRKKHCVSSAFLQMSLFWFFFIRFFY